MHQLQQLSHVWIDTTYTDGRELYYVDKGPGFLTWNSYNLILQFCREQGEIIICGDRSTLVIIFVQGKMGFNDVPISSYTFKQT